MHEAQPLSVAALPLDPGAQARVLLHNLLDSGDIIGRDEAGRAVIQLAADDWLLEQLLTFDAGAEDLAESNDAEADDDAEPDSAPSCGSTGLAIGNTLAGRTLPHFAASAAVWISLTDSDHR